MSKKAIISTISVVLIAVALIGLAVGVSFAAGAWRVDDIKTGVETDMDAWNAAVKDMVFEPITNDAGEAVAYKLIAYRGNMNAIVIPSSYQALPVTTIGAKFTRLNGIAVLTLPSSITTIEDNALMGFKHLKYIKFANGITALGANVLNGCNSLASVWLPKSLVSLGNGALSQCGALETIYFEGAKESITIGEHALSVNNITNGGCRISYNVAEDAAHE